MITAINVAANKDFQVVAMAEGLRLLSEKSGISFESLIKQLPTNKELMQRLAEMVALAAKVLAESVNEK